MVNKFCSAKPEKRGVQRIEGKYLGESTGEREEREFGGGLAVEGYSSVEVIFVPLTHALVCLNVSQKLHNNVANHPRALWKEQSQQAPVTLATRFKTLKIKNTSVRVVSRVKTAAPTPRAITQQRKIDIYVILPDNWCTFKAAAHGEGSVQDFAIKSHTVARKSM